MAKTMTEQRLAELERLSDIAGIPREMVRVDREAQAVTIPAGLFVALCFDASHRLDLVTAFVANGQLARPVPQDAPAAKKRTLSPEHLAKLKAGRERAKAAKAIE